MSVDDRIAQRLLDVLQSLPGRRPLAYLSPPTRLSGGFSADTYAFELLDPPLNLAGPLILRVMRNDADARRETIIHRAVADMSFPAPRVRLSGDASSIFGRPFLVADFARGTDALKEWGVRLAFRNLPDVLAEIMVQLHSLDADPVARELESAGWPRERLGAPGVLTEIETAIGHTGDPGLPGWLKRLRSQRPGDTAACLIHGDLHALNILMEGQRVTAVLDWELARVTDAESDVARTKVILDTVPGMSSALLRPLVQAVGRRAGAAFLENYRQRRGLDEERIRWWEAAHCLRLVAMVAERRTTGRSSSSEGVVGIWDPLVRRLARRFEELMGTG